MANKKHRRRRAVRLVNTGRVPDAAEPREPGAAHAVARTATMVFGGAEVLTIGLLRLSGRLVTSSLVGAITVATQAGALAVDAVRGAISDATEVAREVTVRAGTPGQGRAPAGARRRVSARRAEERHAQPVTALSPPAA